MTDAPPRIRTLLFGLDMVGTFVFALEGALAGIEGRLDLLGVAVLAFATALGGGLIRDVFIGALPPASLADWRYPLIAFAGAGAAVQTHTAPASRSTPVSRPPPVSRRAQVSEANRSRGGAGNSPLRRSA